MLLNEVRETIKKYNSKELQIIIAEMYKAIPKSARESKSIDQLIQDINGYLKPEAIENNKETVVDINALKHQIELFVDYAYKQYYFAANKFIAKKDRPKWRFVVKNYIKRLQSFSGKGEELSLASDLLEKLYKMLCYGCHYYIFNTDNPFQSVGIRQPELLDIVLRRKLENGIDATKIKALIALAINSQLDRDTVHANLMYVALANLKTADAKQMAIALSIETRKEMEKSMPIKSTYSSDKYWHMEKLFNLAEFVLALNFELCQFDEGIQYFKRYYNKSDKEVTLYVLLDYIGTYQIKNYWIREYECAVKENIEPRESLKETYRYIVENGKIPN